MIQGHFNITSRYEKFLGLDQVTSMSEMVRARAVYVVGWSVIVVQILNLALMSYSYGIWTLDHTIASAVISLVFLGVQSLRYHRCFPAFGIFFSVIMFAAVITSALQDKTGINSALIPYLIAGIALNGFICGWRAVATFYVASLVCVYALYQITGAPALVEASSTNDARNFQRAMQSVFALSMIAVISGLFSHNMHAAFGSLEFSLKRAKEADMSKTSFIQNMSHELRTPMNGVLAASDVLMKAGLDSSQHTIAKIIKKSGQKIVDIMDDVLIFSQIASGKLSLSQEPFDVFLCVRTALESHHALADNKGLLLNLHIDPDVPQYVIGDSARLRQILGAFISIAIKFTKQGAVVVVITAQPETHGSVGLNFAVKDTGIGIAKKDISRIFDRFEQVDNSNARQQDGTGLGLTISSQLVEAMGGSIHAQSVIGRGSAFTARLRFKVADVSAALPTPTAKPAHEDIKDGAADISQVA